MSGTRRTPIARRQTVPITPRAVEPLSENAPASVFLPAAWPGVLETPDVRQLRTLVDLAS